MFVVWPKHGYEGQYVCLARYRKPFLKSVSGINLAQPVCARQVAENGHMNFLLWKS